MADTVICVENLSKRYRIGSKQRSYKTLREAITGRLRAPTRRLSSGKTNSGDDTFWALDDISFEVKQGEVLGVIGSNGAGKSTLLKILSHITEPTAGAVYLKGRVGSLLEVGTGFHPELTGRENIYLNGAILGMSRSEIVRKFEEIIDFAGVEQFIDTPVKRYSSGMYLRLAFSVAAHLEPEILLVDEVLAVGDAAFQQKCLGKMQSVARGGRTVLFVSHSMASIEALCTRAICLQKGHLVQDGAASDVIAYYLNESRADHAAVSLTERKDRVGSGEASFTQVRFRDAAGEQITQLPMGASLTIEADYQCHEKVVGPVFGFLIADKLSNVVLRGYSHESFPGVVPTITADGTVRCTFEHLPLMYGNYYLHLWVSRHGQAVDYIENAASIEVLQSDVYHTGRPPNASNGGICFAPHEWSFSG